jgi:hypothetical protein
MLEFTGYVKYHLESQGLLGSTYLEAYVANQPHLISGISGTEEELQVLVKYCLGRNYDTIFYADYDKYTQGIQHEIDKNIEYIITERLTDKIWQNSYTIDKANNLLKVIRYIVERHDLSVTQLGIMMRQATTIYDPYLKECIRQNGTKKNKALLMERLLSRTGA